MKKKFHKIKTCRVCGSRSFTEILDLGSMPPANSFRTKKDLATFEPTFPLVLSFCNTCSLVQLSHIVDPKFLFQKYTYLTSASKPLIQHFESYAKEISKKYITRKDDLVVEIGSNDGVLLEALKKNCRVLGVDPAKNIQRISAKRKVETICDFFSSSLAEKIQKKYGHAKVVVANNVIAHIDNIKDIFKGVKTLLSSDGVFIFEVHWVGNLIGQGGFDQIYHEHLSYFSLRAIDRLSQKMGLTLTDVKLVPTHGQSLRCYIAKKGKAAATVRKFLHREKKMGLDTLITYNKFEQKVMTSKKQLTTILKTAKENNKKIIGYGAPAKGNTLLNYFEIGPASLDFITDTTHLKQGLFTPGTHIPIVSPEKISAHIPDYILLLSWNYATQILEKEKALRARGVKFIIPVPRVKIL